MTVSTNFIIFAFVDLINEKNWTRETVNLLERSGKYTYQLIWHEQTPYFAHTMCLCVHMVFIMKKDDFRRK
jgi:hypothetical protein